MKQERRKCPHTGATEATSVGSHGPILVTAGRNASISSHQKNITRKHFFPVPDACWLIGVNQCSFRIQFNKTELSFYLWKMHKHRAVERRVVKA